MQDTSQSKKLLGVYLITMLGSSLTTVVTFLLIEKYFQSNFDLGLALSLRTVAFMFFSYSVPVLLNYFGEKKSLLLAQAFGLLALCILYYGLTQRNFSVVMIGLVCTGLPGNITTTGLIASLRGFLPEDSKFRLFSGRRELIAGLTLTTAGFISPILIQKLSLEYILFFDGITYSCAVIGLSFLKFPLHQPVKNQVFPGREELLNKHVIRFLLCVAGSLFLMATLPLIASSTSLQAKLGLTGQAFSHLWGIEGLAGILAGYFYPKLRKNGKTFKAFYFGAIAVLLAAIIPEESIKFGLICLIPLFYSMVFFEERDSLIISAGSDRNLINSHAAAASLIRSFFGTLSPICLLYVFEHTTFVFAALIFLGIQIISFPKSKSDGSQ